MDSRHWSPPGIRYSGLCAGRLRLEGKKLVEQVPEEVFAEKLAPILSRQNDLLNEMLHSENPVRRRTASNVRLLNRVAAAPVTGQNSVRSFFSGFDKFESLMADIEAAEKSIHMEYFIWRSDELGERIRKALERKVAEGVSVRLLFDGWGSFGRISFSYRRALRSAGVEYAYFLSLSNPVARLKINYRNHRKIAVFDGRIAYTGGMNIGREYIDGGKNFETWRDTHLRIEGPAVSMLQALFLVDWRNSGKELLAHELLFPEFPATENRGGIPIQIAISGPDSVWDGIRLHYAELINGAREEILIQTPYFIPGEEVQHAMIGAAASWCIRDSYDSPAYRTIVYRSGPPRHILPRCSMRVSRFTSIGPVFFTPRCLSRTESWHRSAPATWTSAASCWTMR